MKREDLIIRAQESRKLAKEVGNEMLEWYWMGVEDAFKLLDE